MIYGPVSYPIAVIIRALNFYTVFMHEATVISILIMRQIIIFKVIIFIRLVKVIKQLSQPVWFCNMDHEKSSGWLKFIIAFGSIGVITLENVKNYGGRCKFEDTFRESSQTN